MLEIKTTNLPGKKPATKAPPATANTLPKFGIPEYPCSKFRLRETMVNIAKKIVKSRTNKKNNSTGTANLFHYLNTFDYRIGPSQSFLDKYLDKLYNKLYAIII